MSSSTTVRRRPSHSRRPHRSANGHAIAVEGDELKRRVKQLLEQEIDYIGNREFSARSAKNEILGPRPGGEAKIKSSSNRLPKDLPAHLARLCEAPLLTADEERDLFRRMNFLKYRANVLRSRLSIKRPNYATVAELDACLHHAKDVRDEIIRANMRLVISIVKKFVTPKHSFDDLLSDGIESLMHAVDKFDYDKGFRFSTYAYRAIARNAYRSITDRHKEESRFDSSASDDLPNVADETRTSALDEKEWMTMRTTMLQLLDHLDRRERFILRGRFALGAHRKVRTFQCLADKLGVSKERVRQLEQRAIAKLKAMVEKMQADGDGALATLVS